MRRTATVAGEGERRLAARAWDGRRGARRRRTGLRRENETFEREKQTVLRIIKELLNNYSKIRENCPKREKKIR